MFVLAVMVVQTERPGDYADYARRKRYDVSVIERRPPPHCVKAVSAEDVIFLWQTQSGVVEVELGEQLKGSKPKRVRKMIKAKCSGLRNDDVVHDQRESLLTSGRSWCSWIEQLL